MSLGRRVTFTVIFTITFSVLSTVFFAIEVEATEEPLSISPVAMGPKAPKLSATAAFEIGHSIPTPEPVKFTALPETRSAQATITTKQQVVEQLQSIRREGIAGSVIDFAMAQLGDTYVWGGNGPNGWDCSGLTVGAFRTVGVNLPRTSRAQWTVGTPVEYGQWQPGDLLFYGSSASSIHHVALYIGDGQIVHASTFGVPVKTDPVRGGGSDYFGAKRVL